MNDDPMLSADEDTRQQYINSVNQAVRELVEQDAAQRRYWASRSSVSGTTTIGQTGFGDGPHAVDTPQ